MGEFDRIWRCWYVTHDGLRDFQLAGAPVQFGCVRCSARKAAVILPARLVELCRAGMPELVMAMT